MKTNLLEWILAAVGVGATCILVSLLTICLASAVSRTFHDHPRIEYRLLRLCHESTSDLFLRSDGVRVLKPFINSSEPDVLVADTVKNEDVCK